MLPILAKSCTAIAAVYFLIYFFYPGIMNISGGSSKSGTPDPSRQRGELLRVVKHGEFRIEVRSYEAGKSASSSTFCDYWVEHNGKPVLIDQENYQNHYNSCGALLLLDVEEPTFLLGSHTGSDGGYVPIVVTEEDGFPVVLAYKQCALSAQTEGYDQAYRGWRVESGKVEFCGRAWSVLPFSSDTK